MGQLRPRDVSDTLDVDPFTPVSSFCSTTLQAVRPTDSLRDVLPLFKTFTGLPVVDASGLPVGVISDKDVALFVKSGSGDAVLDTAVSSVMSAPAVTIREDSPLAYAAGKMLQFKVHRLVVVDHEGKAVAMLTRTDVFQPLVPDVRKSDASFYAKVETMAAQAKATGTVASSRLQETLDKLKGEKHR
jgi:CBS domain-containing protein